MFIRLPMQWAKVVAVMSGVVLLLSTSATLNTFAQVNLNAKAGAPVSLTFGMNGCKNDLTCAADFLIGDTVTFGGSLATPDGTPIAGEKINVVKLTSKPELIVIASGVTGIDGSYTVSWTAQFTPREKAIQDVTKKFLHEDIVVFATFGGDDKFGPAKTGKLTATIDANQLLTSVNVGKRVYGAGESAIVFIGFIDSRDQFVDPDSMRVLYDDQELKVEKKKTGSYTVTTPSLTVEHHQVFVIPTKEGYNIRNGFVTVSVSGFFSNK